MTVVFEFFGDFANILTVILSLAAIVSGLFVSKEIIRQLHISYAVRRIVDIHTKRGSKSSPVNKIELKYTIRACLKSSICLQM